MFLKFLPPVLLPPGSKPPPPTYKEVTESKLLKRCKPGCIVAHADGAHAYPAVIKKLFRRICHRSVSHKNLEFVKAVRPVTLPNGKRTASLTGT